MATRTRRALAVLALVGVAAAGCSGSPTSEPTGSPAGPTGSAPGTGTGEPTATATGDPGTASGYDWTDPRRRQAVSMAIDRQAIVDVIFQGARTVADDFWPASFVGYRGGDWCPNLTYDPERALQLWEEAGGNAGPVVFWFNSGSGHEEWVEAVANQLQATLGVESVEYQSLLFADFLDKLELGEVNGPFRLGWSMDYPSPGNFLGPIHVTAGSSNRTGYTNPAFDELVAEGNALPLEDSVAAYQAAGDILCEDLPIAPVFFGKSQVAHSPNVDNVVFDAFQALDVTSITDLDGDGAVSMYICEPQNGLWGSMTNESCGSEVLNGLFAGLFSLDKESGELVFDKVAESIETSDDGTNWTITLADGWTFHDGTPVTAQSFVDAWNWAALGA